MRRPPSWRTTWLVLRAASRSRRGRCGGCRAATETRSRRRASSRGDGCEPRAAGTGDHQRVHVSERDAVLHVLQLLRGQAGDVVGGLQQIRLVGPLDVVEQPALALAAEVPELLEQ